MERRAGPAGQGLAHHSKATSRALARYWASLVAQMVKNLPATQGLTWVRSCVRKIPWRREWLPTLVFLPGAFHGQRSLVGYSPWAWYWGRFKQGNNKI